MLHFFCGHWLRYTLGEFKKAIDLKDSGFQPQKLKSCNCLFLKLISLPTKPTLHSRDKTLKIDQSLKLSWFRWGGPEKNVMLVTTSTYGNRFYLFMISV